VILEPLDEWPEAFLAALGSCPDFPEPPERTPLCEARERCGRSVRFLLDRVARRGSRKLRRELEALYSGLEVLPYDVEAVRRYGRLAAALLDEGVPMGVEDTMVAAHALSRGLVLVTHDRQRFELVSGVRVEDWF
jgi:predicted nucleic acid-binding protein